MLSLKTAYERGMRAQRTRFLQKNLPLSEMSNSVHFVCRLHTSIGVGSLAHRALVGFLAPPGQIAWRSFLMWGFLNGVPRL